MISGCQRRANRGSRHRTVVAAAVLGLTALLGGNTVRSQAPAAETTLMRVGAERATLRGKPAPDAPAVTELTRGQDVRVLERAGAWMLVRVVASGQEGFVHGLLLEEVPVAPAAGPPATLQLSVLLVDDQLAIKPVPRHVVLLTPASGGTDPIRLVAGFDGRVEASVPAGSYTLVSERAVDFQGRTYRWELPLTFKAGERLSIDLSVDNAAGTPPQGGAPVAGTSSTPAVPPAPVVANGAASEPNVAGAVAVSGQSSTPVTPAAEVNVVGLWEGTYADSPARLRVTEQVGASFTATLSVTTQAGRADSEIQVTGRVSAGVVELTETAVIARGAARAWSLGRGAGTIDADGRAMRGTGRDGRSEYRWSFTLAVGPTVTAPASDRTAVVESRPADVPRSPMTASTESGGSTTALPDVARAIVKQQLVVAIPDGKALIKHELGSKAPSFPLEFGPSKVVLFRMPVFRGPYTLTVRTLCKCVGFSKKIFAAQGVFLDADLQVTRAVSEVDFVVMASSMRKPFRAEVDVVVDGTRSRDAYLLLFTDARLVGTRAGRVDALGAAVTVLNYPVGRGAEGTIEFETRVASEGATR